MKSPRLSHSIPCIVSILFVILGSGCDIELGGWNQISHSRFERTVRLQVPLGGSDALDVFSRNGSIAVVGTDAADCNIVATVVAHAPTEEEARELAEKVEIAGEPAGATLKVRSHEPDLANNRSISVAYKIAIPRRMNIRCESSYGSLDVSNIEGRVDGKSGNGSVKARDIQGTANLNSDYGSVECRNVTGQSITLHSGNGSITMANLRGAVTAESSYGSVSCEDSSGGDLRLRSGNGRVDISHASFGACEARSSYGAIGGNNLKGDSIEMHSGNGSVEIADAETKELNLSSSYGSIRATQIVASSLAAESGNGSVHVVCAATAPADLDARARSSYGSVEFTAPPTFAGEVYLSTNYGGVRTALPVTVSGEMNKRRLVGKVGEGTGKIHLESGSGSVELK